MAHKTVGLASLNSAGQVSRLEGWEELTLQLEVSSLEAEFLPPRGFCIFLLRLSTGWVRPSHILEGNLLYLKSAELNVNLI